MTSILHVGITVEEIKRVNPASELALYDSHPCLRKCFRACTNYLRFFLAFLASIETIIQRLVHLLFLDPLSRECFFASMNRIYAEKRA